MTKRRTRRRPSPGSRGRSRSGSRGRSRRRSGRRARRRFNPAIFIIALILILGAVYAVQSGEDLESLTHLFTYSNNKADLQSYFDIKGKDDVAIVLGDEYIEQRAKLWDGEYYADIEVVRNNLNSKFYYSKEDGTLQYTTPDTIITANIGEKTWTDSQGGAGEEKYVIAKEADDTLYVALDYVKKYSNFSYEGYTEPNHIQLTASWDEQAVATIARKTELRIKGGPKSDVLRKLDKGENVVLLEEYENWVKVKSEDSLIGYIEKKKLKDARKETPEPVTDYQEPEYTRIKKDQLINLGFHSIGSEAGNATLTEYLANTKGLNVIAPQWLYIEDAEGTVGSVGSADYVKEAHAAGLDVWVVFDDNRNKENFKLMDLLPHAESRAKIIKEALAQVTLLGADGLNLDFESIDKPEKSQPFIEFVREMSIACRAQGIVFSIDNYYPIYNKLMNIKEQGVVADYIILMGYDEHTNSSPEPGPVASIGFVEQGIDLVLNDVDPSKVINAVPFYSRAWYPNDEGNTTCEVVHMKNIDKYLSDKGITVSWDEETGQNYGSNTTSDGTQYEIWVEDPQSLAKKIEVMKSKNLAGIAEWAIGQETSEAWDVITSYIEGQ
jgi:spore germination protein YaaH